MVINRSQSTPYMDSRSYPGSRANLALAFLPISTSTIESPLVGAAAAPPPALLCPCNLPVPRSAKPLHRSKVYPGVNAICQSSREGKSAQPQPEFAILEFLLLIKVTFRSKSYYPLSDGYER